MLMLQLERFGKVVQQWCLRLKIKAVDHMEQICLYHMVRANPYNPLFELLIRAKKPYNKDENLRIWLTVGLSHYFLCLTFCQRFHDLSCAGSCMAASKSHDCIGGTLVPCGDRGFPAR